MSELKTSLSFGRVRWVLTGAGGGAGLAIALTAIKALTTRPEFLPQLINGNLPYLGLMAVGLVIASRKADAFVAMHERSVVANERLAANVGALVDKDDSRERRLDLLMGELARTSENTASSVRRIESWIDGQRKISE